jgi:hypothetical protein
MTKNYVISLETFVQAEIKEAKLICLHDDSGTLTFARRKKDRASTPGGRSRATTVGVALEAEFAPPHVAPDKQPRGHGDHRKSCDSLPIHVLTYPFVRRAQLDV